MKLFFLVGMLLLCTSCIRDSYRWDEDIFKENEDSDSTHLIIIIKSVDDMPLQTVETDSVVPVIDINEIEQ